MTSDSSTSFFTKITPAVRKPWLNILSGLMWSGVGIFLCSLTVPWLQPVELGKRVLFILPGLILAVGIYAFGFSRYADINIQRIEVYAKEKVCIFAFQKWTSYPLVFFMIALGIVLRVYSPIPKPWLAVLYIGIGGSLFLASIRYFAHVWNTYVGKRNSHG